MNERDIFLNALEKTTLDSRQSYLDEACGEDDKLRQHIEELLQAHEAAGSFLDQSPLGIDVTIDSKQAVERSDETLPPMGRDEPTEVTQAGATIRYFGDYELLEEIARGGMGVVYKARQVSLNRTVALKMILSAALASKEDVERFHVEAEAAANLDHPNVVPIYEVGDHEGQHYFSMKLIEGGTLAERHATTACDNNESARLMATVARAVHAAHHRGILHRDLKPGNILVDGDGKPHVTDFGLAKRVEGDSGLTRSGQIMGTPKYMAPEQARGGGRRLTVAADIYSLGAILYESVAGRPPFEGDSLIETIRLVTETEPPRPRSINQEVDRDLETIILKCLDKEPRRRYDSAAALADDLERWLRGEPISARPVSTFERAVKWMRRKPVAAALVGTAALLLLTLSVGGPLAAWQQNKLRREADAARDDAEQSRGRAAAALENEHKARLQVEQQKKDAETAREEALTEKAAAHEARQVALAEKKAAEDARRREADLRVQEQALRRQADEATRIARQQTELAEHRLEEARRGAYNIQLARVEQLWRQYPDRAKELLEDADFCPDELRDFTWKLLHEACLRTPRGLAHPGGVRLRGINAVVPVALSADGQELIWAAGTKVIVWDVRGGKQITTFEADAEAVQAIAYSSDGALLVTAGVGASIKLWERPFNSEPRELEGHGPASFKGYARVNDLSISSDGKVLASAGEDGTVRLWSLPIGELKAVLTGHAKGVRSVSFDPTAQRLASSDSATVRIWNVQTEELHKEFKAWGSGQVAYSPDGRSLATCTGRSTHIRDAESGEIRGDVGMHARAIAFSGDGSMIATADTQGDGKGPVTVWDTNTGLVLGSFRGYQGGTIALSATGDTVYFGGATSTFAGDVQPRLEARSWQAHQGQINSLVWSPDHKSVITGAGDQTIKVWNAATGQLLKTLEEDFWIWSIAVSPDGKRLAAATWTPADRPGPVNVWNLDSGAREFALKPNDGPIRSMIQTVAYSPDGKLLATGGLDNKIRLWDATSGEHLGTLAGHEHWVSSVAFSSDSKTLVSAVAIGLAGRGEIAFWDVQMRHLLRRVKDNPGAVTSIALLPDDSLLASVDNDKTISLWDVATGERRTSIKWGTVDVSSIAFSPDGQTMVSSGSKVSLWDAKTGQARVVLTTEDGFTNAAFAGDGKRLAAAGPDRSIHIWELDEGREK